MKELSVNGITLRYDVRGHGDPLILLHGNGEGEMAADILEFIRRLDLHDVTLAGFSDGGIIGLIAASQTDRIKTLIACGANASPDGLILPFRMINHVIYALTRSPLFRLMIEEPDIRDEELQQITARTLITAGQHDVIRQEETDHIASCIKGARENPEIRKQVLALSGNGAKPLNDFLAPRYSSTSFSPGSTDVGDVSWLTPTSQIETACWPAGVPGHSWQIVACGKSGFAHKGMLFAAKVLAATAVDLLTDAELLEKAKAEFSERAAGGYVCPIETDAVPIAL